MDKQAENPYFKLILYYYVLHHIAWCDLQWLGSYESLIDNTLPIWEAD